MKVVITTLRTYGCIILTQAIRGINPMRETDHLIAHMLLSKERTFPNWGIMVVRVCPPSAWRIGPMHEHNHPPIETG